MIENYMGFPQGINGADLAERARQQAVKFGVELLMMQEGVESTFHDDRILDRPRRRRDDGGPHQCLRHRRGVASSQLPNEDKLLGRGLYYGAGASEAPLCGGEDVHVVGGGNSAGDVLGQGGREPRLADTRLAGDQNHSSFAALRLLPTADKQLDFLVTPDEGNFWPPLSDYNNDCRLT